MQREKRSVSNLEHVLLWAKRSSGANIIWKVDSLLNREVQYIYGRRRKGDKSAEEE